MMKNSSIKNSLLCALLILIPVVLSSCLSGENRISSRVQVGLEFKSINDTLTRGQDTVKFDKVRLILGESYFLQSEGDTLFLNRQPAQVTFDAGNSSAPRLLASGTFPEATYTQIKLTVPKAPLESNALIDDDFTDGNIRFTIIAEGTYNGSAFKFRSERVFAPAFTFQPNITVPEFNQAFSFIISNDLAGWLLSGNRLLDPGNPDNSLEINDNIEGLFTIDIPE